MKKTNKKRIGFVLCFLLGCLATAIPMILSQGPEQSHPASQVSPGTFKTGDYIYPNNLRINGNLDMDNGAITNIDWINSDDGSGSGLDADTLDGLSSGSFLTTASDYGRSGVAADLYEGASTLTSKYVNEGQANSVTSGMITDGTIANADISGTAAITWSKISCSDCIGSGNIATGGVTSTEISDGTIATADIGDNQVTSAKVNFNYAWSSSKGGAANNSNMLNGQYAPYYRQFHDMDCQIVSTGWVSATSAEVQCSSNYWFVWGDCSMSGYNTGDDVLGYCSGIAGPPNFCNRWECRVTDGSPSTIQARAQCCR